MRRFLWLAAPLVPLFFVGVISTFYQAISGNVICCRGDIGRPVGIYLIYVPTLCLVAIVKLVIWRSKKKH